MSSFNENGDSQQQGIDPRLLQPASYPIQIFLNDTAKKNLQDARDGIKLEFYKASRWEKLKASEIRKGPKTASGIIYRI